MLRKYFLSSIAIIGAIIGLLVVFWSQKKQPTPPIPFKPPKSPYVHAIFGEGIVEAAQNISVGSPFSEVITKVFVVEGDKVKKGDPLFQLDIRRLEAEAKTINSQIQVARINLQNKKTQFAFYERLEDKKAVSEQSYQQTYFALQEAKEQVKVVQAQLEEVKTNIERSLIRSPVNGEILQINIHVGEIAPNVTPISSKTILPYGSSQFPLILMGNIEPFYIRIDIDEEDAWRFQKNVPATAFVRGNSRMHFPLQFVRVEPYIVPKASFTGQTTERIDTRVLQVLYRFLRNDVPIYAGQILDVFIEAPPIYSLEVQDRR